MNIMNINEYNEKMNIMSFLNPMAWNSTNIAKDIFIIRKEDVHKKRQVVKSADTALIIYLKKI